MKKKKKQQKSFTNKIDAFNSHIAIICEAQIVPQLEIVAIREIGKNDYFIIIIANLFVSIESARLFAIQRQPHCAEQKIS